MTEADFIPAGRTSRINKENSEIQIQTEYAYRPNPRLTTSVITGGQVIHKIQHELKRPISSIQEKLQIERILQKQHMEIIQVVKSDNFSLDMAVKAQPIRDAESLTVADRLARINGVVNVFKVDNEGNFDSTTVSTKFKKFFKSVFKNIQEIMEIFAQLPEGKRESGVVEVERRRLYLVSSGKECYFILMDGLTPASLAEAGIRDALYGSP